MANEEASRPRKELVDDTLDEHRSCMRIVADLETYLEQPADRAGDWAEGLGKRIARLAGTLRSHFEAEQRGPLFRQLPLTHPRLASRLTRLEKEHDEILTDAESTLAKAEGLRDGAESYQLHELNARVQLLIAKIQRHESEENELVLEAHWNELGMGD
jgi:hypothetical protein